MTSGYTVTNDWRDKVQMSNENERIETFTNRLNEAMSVRNLKSVDLVKKTKLSKQQISQYVNGKFEAKQRALYLLAQVLDVSEAWLMGFNVPMEKSISISDSEYDEWNKTHNSNNKLIDEVKICELIEKRYGKPTLTMLTMYNQLDSDDQAEIRGEIKGMLKSEKYSIKKEYKNA